MSSKASSERIAGKTVASVSGAWIGYTHTFFALSAFLLALFVGLACHYKKIVKNEFYGYPEEWFPSVSATIGDFYPERNVFQIFIAITSGPRFALVLCWYLLTRRSNTRWPAIVAWTGLIRTVTCGGWVYITSTDAHDWHDIFMISYLLCTIPWMFGSIACTPVSNKASIKYRKLFAGLFFGSIVPLIYFFIQHKIKQVAGAYTIYAFWEWSLIFYDVLFDSITSLDLSRFELRVVDVQDSYSGPYLAPPLKELKEGGDIRGREKLADNLLFAPSSMPLREVASFWADVYLSFIFWTNMTALGPMIFYYSVWGMGLTGVEAFLLVNLSPILLVITPLRDVIVRFRGVFQLVSLAGIAGCVLKDDFKRLQLITLSVAVQSAVYAAVWWSKGSSGRKDELERETLTWGIGLIFSLVAKLARHSLNPMWPIMWEKNGGWNRVGLVLAGLSALDIFFRSRSSPSSAITTAASVKKPKTSFALASIGLGGLLFCLHQLFTDAGTIITWVWNGYPITGPVPVPHSVMTIAALAIGLAISVRREDVVLHPLWAVMGCAACFSLGVYPGWKGFWGGVLLAVFTTSLIPIFIRTAAQHGPGKTFFLAWLVYNLFVLANIWTTAYAFVPGGPLLREKTHWVQLFMMVSLCLGIFNARVSTSKSQRLQQHLNNLSLQRTRSLSILALALLTFISAGIAFHRLPAKAPVPYHPNEKVFTAGIWTVHFGLDGNARDSQRRMRDLIKDMELDVVGLLESDLQRIVMGNRDLTQFMAEDLGMYADVGPGPNKHTWGCALLSKFPIINSTHHLLPSPHGELAPAIHATLDVFGTYVDVIVSHNGQEEDPLDRQLQSTELGRIMREAYPRPFVFLGYVVTVPKQDRPAPYWYLVKDGKMLDVDPDDWDRWCEYILFRGVRRTSYARITRGSNPAITDTELQVARFQVPDSPIDPDKDSADYRRLSEEQVPDAWRLPAMFRGEGVRGHYYHVFNEPRYYDA